MYNLVLVLHVIVCISLIGIILVQRGRSGGLVEALGGVESIFGTKTSDFLVKVTIVLSICFFTMAISLAYLSKKKGGSLLENYPDLSIEAENISQEEQVKGFDEEPVVAIDLKDNNVDIKVEEKQIEVLPEEELIPKDSQN
ncbi:MAG: preprotein translocase subunit SecG [Candidatus Omnitrophica bacterium]|nr:preprotein translocase subunit SecG [Candidatus Omnitrophota bacterium]MCK5288629.1 preprotein translocase subunit SecG [Candidatus Omnitrophota bacterium]